MRVDTDVERDLPLNDDDAELVSGGKEVRALHEVKALHEVAFDRSLTATHSPAEEPELVIPERDGVARGLRETSGDDRDR